MLFCFAIVLRMRTSITFELSHIEIGMGLLLTQTSEPVVTAHDSLAAVPGFPCKQLLPALLSPLSSLLRHPNIYRSFHILTNYYHILVDWRLTVAELHILIDFLYICMNTLLYFLLYCLPHSIHTMPPLCVAPQTARHRRQPRDSV